MKNKGITLISLVITIIILIILAGVAINLSLGENGIFKKAKQARDKNNEAIAKEKLELILSDARIEKETNKDYNEELLDSILENNNVTVDESNVIVDNYNFKIDREKLIILENLGETQIKITTNVQKYLGKNANGKYEVQLLTTIESNTSLQKIEITKPDGTTFEIEIQKEKIEKEMIVELDEEYIVKITDKSGKTQNRKIIEKSEESISTAKGLEEFRNKVNNGLTYEGKTIKLIKDTNLSTVCGENVNEKEINWEPIGNNENQFKGTFSGDNHEISNIYINATKDYQGLFGCNSGRIENLSISGNIKNTKSYVGGISGINNGTISNCHNNVDIKSSGDLIGGITGYNYGTIERCSNSNEISSNGWNIGGIAGASTNLGTLRECYNIGYIHANYTVGGIVGYLSNGTIYNSYNKGKISATFNNAGGINGAAGSPGLGCCYTYNCYNTGSISASSRANQITGAVNANGGSSADKNCYSTNATVVALNAGEYSENVWTEDTGINNGYPILKWQVENVNN